MNWTPATLAQCLARSVRERPHGEAIVTPTARLDWTALAARVSDCAGALAAMGVRRGEHVGLLMGNDEHWLAWFYGAATLGAVTVPINTRFRSVELGYCLAQADVKLLVAVPSFLGIDFRALVEEVRPACPRLERVFWHGTGPLPHAAAPADAAVPQDVLLMQFTSGTTAYPKGVLLTHDSMLRNARAAGMRIGIAGEDRYFNCRPFFHVAGSTLSALLSLVAGACLVTLPTFEAGAALALMERERCTLTSGNDTLFQMLMGHEDFPRRRLLLRGGWAAAGPQTMRRIIDVLGARAICAAYGLSEASPNVVMSDWRDPEELRVAGLARPHEGVEVRVRDGEIQVRGWGVMRGYYNDPEATVKAFTDDGWLRTGDLGELTPDGRLRMLGRLKDVFRVGGENVAPAEVEEVLLMHPAVETAQVVGVPDRRLGEVPCAYVTLKDGAAAGEEELKAFVKQRAANFRVPRYLRIVADFEAIGMTASGKVQKARLRAQALKDFGLQEAKA